MPATATTKLTRELLSARVACVEVIGDLEAELYPEEAAFLAGVTHPRRRREFVTGRACARAALEALGVGAVAVPVGPRREPCWPAGVVGSITHCEGDYRAAAVARAEEVLALGIDAEPNRPLPEGVLEVVAGAQERAMLAELGAEGGAAAGRADVPGRGAEGAGDAVCWDRLLFCVKEAVYKAWYPVMQRWLGFDQARVAFGRPDRSFAVRLDEPLSGHGDVLRGRWNLGEHGVLAAAIELPVTLGT